MIHSNVRNVFVSSPFFMLFVRACSPVSPEFPSMFAFTAVHSFILFSSKGSCSSVVFSFHRPTCLLFHVAMLSLPTQDFRKLAVCLPLLFQLETHHSALEFLHYCVSHLLIFIFLRSALLSICFTLLLIPVCSLGPSLA